VAIVIVGLCSAVADAGYSTVTVFARLRGLSMSSPRRFAIA
jgi:hypothetical protein